MASVVVYNDILHKMERWIIAHDTHCLLQSVLSPYDDIVLREPGMRLVLHFCLKRLKVIFFPIKVLS